MGIPEIEAFLTHLAVDQKVAASTQNQALNAILFLYREVLKQDLEGRIDAIRAKRPKRLPTVLTREEVSRVLDAMSGTPQLIARLLYGSGLRLMEAIRLRVKDLGLAQHQVVVRDGKGLKDRVTCHTFRHSFATVRLSPSTMLRTGLTTKPTCSKTATTSARCKSYLGTSLHPRPPAGRSGCSQPSGFIGRR